MKRLTLIALALLAIAGVAQATTTTKLTVNGMVCAFCAQGIEKKIGAMPQTQAVYVNLGQKIVAVEAKAGQTLDAEQLRATVKDAGYEVTKVETVEQSLEQVRRGFKEQKK